MVHTRSGLSSSDAVALSLGEDAPPGVLASPPSASPDPDPDPDGPDASPAEAGSCSCSPQRLWEEARAWRPQLPWSVLLVYCALNFTQELPVTAVSYLLVNEIGLSPAQQTVFYATIMLPWWAKPGYALVSDAFPILSFRRRPYLLLCSFGVALSYLAISLLAVTPSTMLSYNISASIFVCFCEVVADSIAIEITNRGIKRSASLQLPASIQSECMAARTVGSLLAASLSLALLSFWPPRVVIAITAAGPIATGAMAFFVPDERVPAGYLAQTAKSFMRTDLMVEKFHKYVSAARELAFPLFFVFLCNLVPTYDDAYEYYLTDHNAYGGFTPNQLAAFQLAGTAGALLGTLLYWRFCSRTNIRRVYVIGIFIGALSSGTEIVFALGLTDRMHLSPAWYVALDSVLVSVCSRVALMPGVVLAAMSCPPGIEAVMLGLFATAQQVATYVSAYGTAALTDGLGVRQGSYSNLWLLMAICVGSTLAPLLLLRWLPEKPFVARSDLAFAAADPTQVEPSESEISVALLHPDDAGSAASSRSPSPSPSPPSYGSLSSSTPLAYSPPAASSLA